MALQVYNTLTRRKETFTPLEPGHVGMYVCGPTVYDHAHIGHGKLYISMDIIVRYLRFTGIQVLYVQNITDVGHLLDSGEDRILKGARREKTEPMQVVERYMRSYMDDMDALRNLRPDIMPRATGHVPEQIAAVERLIETGHAYEMGGSVYFDVSSAPTYGKLSGSRVQELEVGTRVNFREEKRSPQDFALWKRADSEHIMRWRSPWGEGFPGWHIECSAMAEKYLGANFDIHGGGLDNIFPHNECEIAQSEAMSGIPYANYWMHAGPLTVEGVKMSKSLGNSVTLRKALQQYPPEVLRFFMLSSHYRSPIDYSDDALAAAGRGWERLVAPALEVQRALRQPEGEKSVTVNFTDSMENTRADFSTAMNDDFNAPGALAVLFDFTKQINTMLAEHTRPDNRTLHLIDSLYRDLAGDVLGLLPIHGEGSREDKLVGLLSEIRSEARAREDFTTSDKIREQLRQTGVTLEDGKSGTTWKIDTHSSSD